MLRLWGFVLVTRDLCDSFFVIFCISPPESGLAFFFFSSTCLWYYDIFSIWVILMSYSTLLLLVWPLWFPLDVLGLSTPSRLFLNLYRLLLAVYLEASFAIWSSSIMSTWLSLLSAKICSSSNKSLELLQDSIFTRMSFASNLLMRSPLSILFSLKSFSKSFSNFWMSSSSVNYLGSAF